METINLNITATCNYKALSSFLFLFTGFTVNPVKESRRLPSSLHEWTKIIRVIHIALIRVTKKSQLTFGAQIFVCSWKPHGAQEKRVPDYLLSHDLSSLLKQKHNFFSITSFDRIFNCSIASKLLTLVSCQVCTGYPVSFHLVYVSKATLVILHLQPWKMLLNYKDSLQLKCWHEKKTTKCCYQEVNHCGV